MNTRAPFNTWLRGYRLLVGRGAFFTLLWWLLTEGQPGSWSIGLLFILSATLLSARLTPPTPRSLPALLRFIPFFLSHSLKGGIDVAWRALHPSLPIAPLVIDYPLRLADAHAQVFMANTTSLLPGTLSVSLDNKTLQVHVLDGHGNYRQALQTLEQRVAELYLLCLKEEDHGNI